MMFRTVLTLLFVVIAFSGSAQAQNGGVYTVNDVKVDIVAASSVKARDQAFAAAQEKGFKMLSERFLSPEQQVNFVPPSAATIAGMVADFEITSEQLSKRRYLGTYIFRFKAMSVNRYFGHGPISGESVAASRQLLIIPTFSQNGEASLWDIKKNPWLQAWQKNTAIDPTLLIPFGNVSDTMDIRQVQPDKITQTGLRRIKARYNAYDVVIVSAVFNQSATDILKVNIYRTDRGLIELTQTMPIPVGKATKLGELLNIAVTQTQPVLMRDWKAPVEEVPAYTDESLAADEMTTPLTATAAVTPGAERQSGQVQVAANFNSIGQWLEMRRSLNGIASLKAINIASLTTNQANMQLVYSDWMALTSALTSRGLSLQSTGPGTYILVKTASSSGYR